MTQTYTASLNRSHPEFRHVVNLNGLDYLRDTTYTIASQRGDWECEPELVL
jgi:hypothetical protein